MSPPGRPKGEYRSAQHGDTPTHPPGRPKGEYRSAQHEDTPAHPPQPTPPGNGAGTIDSSYLESLVGYNARRAALSIIGLFLERMAIYDLRPVDFSILSLVTHNPGITSRQLCATLGILPPNLVAMVGTLDKRGLIKRTPHRSDGRAMSLYLTRQGEQLMREAEKTAAHLEREATTRLNAVERATLIRLLQKVYL